MLAAGGQCHHADLDTEERAETVFMKLTGNRVAKEEKLRKVKTEKLRPHFEAIKVAHQATHWNIWAAHKAAFQSLLADRAALPGFLKPARPGRQNRHSNGRRKL